ncbi:MAG: hypothetical protein KAR05_02755 [Candidatus Omnitrophica bacterium]|nr:hypothetical protein [Candidatus Omnitrophota bacterium]
MKAKFGRKQISENIYLSASYTLLAFIRGGFIKIEDVDIKKAVVFDDIENLVKKHSLDIVDALQIYTLTKGKFKDYDDESKPVLITSDISLEKAAKKEGLRTWNCEKEKV